MTKTHLLMLDSGAFSVWNNGATINLKEYIRFCLKYPDVSYYVNLDVIPGIPSDRRSLTPLAIEEACQRGWNNYQKMLNYLPKSKVIPVFHQNDNFQWLTKYMEFGTPYIGISPANDNHVSGKLNWMRQVRKYIFDSAGKPLIRTHGFAVTSYDLMKFWEWHSVDSASWKMAAAWGSIYIPVKTQGQYDYTKPPIIVTVSPASKPKHNKHVLSMSPGVRELVMEFIQECGVQLGTYETEYMEESYKVDRNGGETWLDKKKRIVFRRMEKGVVNSFEDRCIVCAEFVKRSNPVLPIKHIYFAGAPMPYELEYQLGRRLLSYEVLKTGDAKKLHRHLELIREGKK